MLQICAYIILLFSPNLYCLQQVDECGSMEDFTSRTISVKYSFSNFSFKVQLFIFLILTSSLVCSVWGMFGTFFKSFKVLVGITQSEENDNDIFVLFCMFLFCE